MKRRSTLVLLFFACLPCSAQESGHRKPESGRGKVSKTSGDAPSIVEALASRNRPPKHVGDFHEPIFDVMFDWREDARVWDALKLAIDCAEVAWPELVKHLDDERYCTTYESFSEFTYDLTVGEACRDIILRNLSRGYFESVEWGTKESYLTMQTPGFLYDPETLKRWCEERRGKRLFELQIEMCEWAKAELAKRGEFRRVPKRTKDRWIIAVDRSARLLRESRTAVHWEGFGTEERVRYTSNKAKAIRHSQSTQNI